MSSNSFEGRWISFGITLGPIYVHIRSPKVLRGLLRRGVNSCSNRPAYPRPFCRAVYKLAIMTTISALREGIVRQSVSGCRDLVDPIFCGRSRNAAARCDGYPTE